MVVKLMIVKGTLSLREFTLRKAKTYIGRKRGGSIRIPSSLVSRIHCVIICEDGRVRIKDLGSSNGTFVNGAPVREEELQAGDSIVVGPVTFQLEIDGKGVVSTKQTQPSSEPAFFTEDEPGEVVATDGAVGDDTESVLVDAVVVEAGADPEFVMVDDMEATDEASAAIKTREQEVMEDLRRYLRDDKEAPGKGPINRVANG